LLRSIYTYCIYTPFFLTHKITNMTGEDVLNSIHSKIESEDFDSHYGTGALEAALIAMKEIARISFNAGMTYGFAKGIDIDESNTPNKEEFLRKLFPSDTEDEFKDSAH